MCEGLFWINVRDPLYFWGYGIPYNYLCKKDPDFLPRVMWAKFWFAQYEHLGCKLDAVRPATQSKQALGFMGRGWGMG